MPLADLLEWCIDVLVSRGYGSRREVLEEMYWEEFWQATTIAANLKTEELNSQMRFQFMLHADKKSKGKWKDLPLPFPAEEKASPKDKSGISQLPRHLKETVFKSK